MRSPPRSVRFCERWSDRRAARVGRLRELVFRLSSVTVELESVDRDAAGMAGEAVRLVSITPPKELCE
jgi:hypothetical protein